MRQGLVMYGPPASGKDTVTAALCELDPCYQHFERLKVGPGRVTGYRMTTLENLARLRAAGSILWENARYGAVYVVDRPSLVRTEDDTIPVVHLGQVAAVNAVTRGTPEISWVVVQLWSDRQTAATRITERATGDIAARLRAWDETEWLDNANLTIDTSAVSPAEAADLIHRVVSSRWLSRDSAARG
ncbi:kinase [Micromonospora radicis]|uniref:Kinase n=1 Tax=Micromonospora radicis TaxID=1894971 RepID=A0A418MML6_9ACTN|nr:kinase [Micromonospora radicis]